MWSCTNVQANVWSLANIQVNNNYFNITEFSVWILAYQMCAYTTCMKAKHAPQFASNDIYTYLHLLGQKSYKETL